MYVISAVFLAAGACIYLFSIKIFVIHLCIYILYLILLPPPIFIPSSQASRARITGQPLCTINMIPQTCEDLLNLNFFCVTEIDILMAKKKGKRERANDAKTVDKYTTFQYIIKNLYQINFIPNIYEIKRNDKQDFIYQQEVKTKSRRIVHIDLQEFFLPPFIFIGC